MTHSQAIAAVGPTEQAKILVVEDDPDIRKILELYLGEKGFRVKMADGAPRALELLGEEPIENMLRPFQEALVAEAVLALLKLTPSEYHTLTLDTADAPDLEQLLADIYKAGRELVGNELKRQGAAEVAIGDTSESEVAQLQTIADATISRLVNDVQFRAADLATQKAVKGLEGDALEAALRSALEEASTTYVTRGAREAATVVLGKGRRAEGIARADDIGKVIFSALLDRNCCSPCSEEDGTEYESVAVAPQVPFDACEGGAQCRCFLIVLIK